jgi:hypothetical protein
MKIMKLKISFQCPFNRTNHLVSCERPTSVCVYIVHPQGIKTKHANRTSELLDNNKKDPHRFYTLPPPPASCVENTQLVIHGLINNIDTKAKCRHLKILTCKGIFAAGFYQSL